MRSSTSSFKRRAAVVGLALAAVLVAANVLLDAVFHKKEFQALAVDALTPDKELLALGSSRVIFGFDPRAYDVPAVSLCANYLDLAHADQLWELHAAKVPRLKVALIEFDVSTLRYDTDAMNPHGLYDLGVSTLPSASNWLTHFDRSLHSVLAPIFNWRLTPAFYALEKHTTTGLEPMAAVAGHIPSQVNLAFPDTYAANEVRSTAGELAAAAADVYPRNLEALARLVRSQRARGVTPVLVRFPLEPNLRKIYPAAWHEFVAQAYKELDATLGADTPPLWDLTGEERFATKHFRDPDHLNQAGATELASLLAPRLRSWYNRSK